MKWTKITHTENIPVREGRAVKIGAEEIAVFNLGDRFVAVDNRCPHQGGPLADGIVSGNTVVCPLHGWKICTETGNIVKPSVGVCVERYETRVEDGVVMVQLPAREAKKRGNVAA